MADQYSDFYKENIPAPDSIESPDDIRRAMLRISKVLARNKKVIAKMTGQNLVAISESMAGIREAQSNIDNNVLALTRMSSNLNDALARSLKPLSNWVDNYHIFIDKMVAITDSMNRNAWVEAVNELHISPQIDELTHGFVNSENSEQLLNSIIELDDIYTLETSQKNSSQPIWQRNILFYMAVITFILNVIIPNSGKIRDFLFEKDETIAQPADDNTKILAENTEALKQNTQAIDDLTYIISAYLTEQNESFIHYEDFEKSYIELIEDE